MPYATVKDLPPAVKSKYGHHAQTVFLGAFNGALKEYGDESKAFAVAHSAAQKADGEADPRGHARRKMHERRGE